MYLGQSLQSATNSQCTQETRIVSYNQNRCYGGLGDWGTGGRCLLSFYRIRFLIRPGVRRQTVGYVRFLTPAKFFGTSHYCFLSPFSRVFIAYWCKEGQYIITHGSLKGLCTAEVLPSLGWLAPSLHSVSKTERIGTATSKSAWANHTCTSKGGF